ncbi:MAG: arsenite methyltransferase [Acidimicrobiia bacterium]|nr:arsenite methyltransferase [Acidimicrobiia bacterium]
MTDIRDKNSLPIVDQGEACCGDDCCGSTTASTPTDVREEVRARYAQAADTAASGGCCTAEDEAETFGAALYGADLESVPDVAIEASLGCGNPTAVADISAGDKVLDLGSGAGIDVFISARRVGPEGKVYGLDMTDEMLALARKNQQEAGVTNVEFLKGYIEEVPLPNDTVDVVISNCVINLSVDKPKVLEEAFRVLKPGGRFGVSDVVFENGLTADERAERGSYTGCIAGALSIEEFRGGLESAGFSDISIEPTHLVADRTHSAIIKAIKPA